MNKNRTIVKDLFLNEEYLKIKHSSGLDITIINKDFSTSYAILAVNFGSLDNKIILDGKEVELPDGVAHFLEHKLFEEPDGSDAFEKFSLYGANANAYTTYDKTCYLFSATDNLYENLEILLDFVTTPVFNKNSVNKEIGIIAQEIEMGEDDPNRCVYNNMINAMYHNSPIVKDVAGDIKSIKEINPEILLNAYNSFYSFNNMSLCLCGNFEEKRVLDICDRILKSTDSGSINRILFNEPRNVKQKEVKSSMSIAQPIYSFGFKGEQLEDYSKLMRKSISLSIATKAIFGRASNFFELNYSKGVINKSFSVTHYAIRGHLFGIIDGTAIDPYKVYDAVLEEIERIKKNGLSKIDFERAKKSIYSNVIMSFDSSEEISNNFISFSFEDIDFFDYIKTIIDISVEEAYNAFVELFDEKYSVISVINPK